MAAPAIAPGTGPRRGGRRRPSPGHASLTLLATPPGSTPTLVLAVVGLAALAALTLLWWRSRRSLQRSTDLLREVAREPARALELAAAADDDAHGRELSAVLAELGGSRALAELHANALASLDGDRVLEAAARESARIVAADGLHCTAVTCVRFLDGGGPRAQTHSLGPDGTRDIALLPLDRLPDASSEPGPRMLRMGETLPTYLEGMRALLEDGRVRSVALLPLAPPPRSARPPSERIGVLALGFDDRGPDSLSSLRFLPQLTAGLSLALETSRRLVDLTAATDDALLALARTGDWSSAYTRGHSERVAQLAVRLGRELGLPTSELERLRRAALLHDLGVVGIPERLLDRQEAYDEEDRAQMRPHVEIGLAILEPLPSFHELREAIGHHHEWWDGSGYPSGLVAEEIHPLARILSVVDVYEALTSTRPYRGAYPPRRALRHLDDRSGSQFEPRVVEALGTVVLRSLGDDRPATRKGPTG